MLNAAMSFSLWGRALSLKCLTFSVGSKDTSTYGGSRGGESACGLVSEVGCGGSLTVKVRKPQCFRSVIPSETDSEGPFATDSAMTEEVSQG